MEVKKHKNLNMFNISTVYCNHFKEACNFYVLTIKILAFLYERNLVDKNVL